MLKISGPPTSDSCEPCSIWSGVQLCRSGLRKCQRSAYASSSWFASHRHVVDFSTFCLGVSGSSGNFCSGNPCWSRDGISFIVCGLYQLSSKFADRWIGWSQVGLLWWAGHAFLLLSGRFRYLQQRSKGSRWGPKDLPRHRTFWRYLCGHRGSSKRAGWLGQKPNTSEIAYPKTTCCIIFPVHIASYYHFCLYPQILRRTQ